MDSLAEQLTARFYLWEQRGRGWQVWDAPVELEPPFEPFHFFAPRSQRTIDDGRKHTFLSGLIESLRGGSGSPSQENRTDEGNYQSYITPAPFRDSTPISEFSIALTPDEKVTTDQTEQFLLALSLCHSPISFEIIGKNETISFQFSCHEKDFANVEGALKGYFPGIIVERHSEHTLRHLRRDNSLVVDFGLSEEFMRPLRTALSLDPDPLIGLVGALEALQKGETGLLQVLFHSTRFPWTESILRSVSDGSGGSFFADAPEMLTLAREKTKRPLFAAVIRVVAVSSTLERTWDIARGLASGLVQFADPLSNELIPLTNDVYDPEIHTADVIDRTSHRSGMLLNSRELATLVHPPSFSIRSTKLCRYFTKTRPAPASVQGHELIIGENLHRGVVTKVSLQTRLRLQHGFVIGATGSGKSTLLLNLIAQDIEQGNGLAVVDPHGDTIERCMEFVSRRRLKDVVLIDPSDSQNPLGINILSAKSEAEKNVAASDLVAVFRRMSTSWGDQMTVVLGNAIQAFLQSNRGGTLLDLRKFLLEADFRREFLTTVTDREVRYFWEKQHHILRGNTLGSLLTRLDTFLRPQIVRRVVAPEGELNFHELLNRKKILLVKLAQGLIGEENSTLLGTLVVSKLYQAAMARQALPTKERTPFILYLEEGHNFVCPSLAGVLSGTRKYGLGLVFVAQNLLQIFNQDTAVANSLISNPCTRICFRVGDFDAQKLKEGFNHFDARDLQNLGLGEAICRVERSDDDFNLKIFPPRAVNLETAKSRRKRIIELSHQGQWSASLTVDEETEKAEPEDTHIEVETPASSPNESTRRVTPPAKDAEATFHPVKPVVPAPPIEDKSLSQHRYLQTLIKRMAEDRGYRATIEEPTPDGTGRVDVGLVRNDEKIACEIAVTTTDEHELHNISKCLRSGYDKIIVCSPEKKRLEAIRKMATSSIAQSELMRVVFLEPEALFSYLEQSTPSVIEGSTEERVKGYRVKVRYQTLSDTEKKRKKDAVADVILQSFRQLKKEE